MQINNHDYLASRTCQRHQVPDKGCPVYDQLDAQGEPIYPGGRCCWHRGLPN